MYGQNNYITSRYGQNTKRFKGKTTYPYGRITIADNTYFVASS